MAIIHPGFFFNFFFRSIFTLLLGTLEASSIIKFEILISVWLFNQVNPLTQYLICWWINYYYYFLMGNCHLLWHQRHQTIPIWTMTKANFRNNHFHAKLTIILLIIIDSTKKNKENNTNLFLVDWPKNF